MDERSLYYCRMCRKSKPSEEFYPSNLKLYKVFWRCKPCTKEANKQWRAENPDRVRNSALKSKYNVDLAWYEKMFELQGGGCWLCKKTPEENGKSLSVDHDHACCPGEGSCGQCVRGLLCSSCNTGLGYFKDNPNLLREAADYVEYHSDWLVFRGFGGPACVSCEGWIDLDRPKGSILCRWCAADTNDLFGEVDHD